jgi:poly(A) polymerase
MVEPIVLPRSEHTLSSRDIDADALRVMSRLQEAGHTAFLVGGSVRDLLLDRRPKDFDIGTSAQPHQIKRLFRNCWIIGRRFRLAHVKFGPKTIEVATFRRNVRAEESDAAGDAQPDLLVQRDNAYGTPEEDAFRRDFTVNALFYDSSNRSIIDYVGGLQDLETRVIRSIGDPVERFQEDPVRMLRAVVLAERLGFDMDPAVVAAIEELGSHIRFSAAPRLMEEYFKILRSGYAEASFSGLARAGLIEHISPEMEEGLSAEFFASLARLDAWRRQFTDVPDALTSTILVGSLLEPLGQMDDAHRKFGVSEQWYPALGRLPVPRKDVERFVQLQALVPKLRDIESASRHQHALLSRGVFREALTWLDIYSDERDVVEHWKGVLAEPAAHAVAHAAAAEEGPNRRRRRRRRRRGPTHVPAA